MTGEFPSQRPVTWSFDVFFEVRLNKQFSKQSWCRWFETLSGSLWRHCNVQKLQTNGKHSHLTRQLNLGHLFIPMEWWDRLKCTCVQLHEFVNVGQPTIDITLSRLHCIATTMSQDSDTVRTLKWFVTHKNALYLTHNRWIHTCVSKVDHYCFRWWLVACSVPTHHLNQCWMIVNWILENKLQWNLNQNTTIFLPENKLKLSSPKWPPFCLDIDDQCVKNIDCQISRAYGGVEGPPHIFFRHHAISYGWHNNSSVGDSNYCYVIRRTY